MRFSPALALLTLSLAATTVSAGGRQLPMLDFVQEAWDAKEGGLPHPGVTSLLQARDGYLWIGTFSGLARFDGHEFSTDFAKIPALEDHIRTVLELPDGSLWVGTRRSGALRIRDGQVLQTLTTKEGLPTNDVIGFAVTRDGTLWMMAGALVSLSPQGAVRRYGADDGIPSPQMYALTVDRDGTLWVGGADHSLAWLEGPRFHAVKWASSPARSDKLIDDRIIDLQQDGDGALWMATAGGILRSAGERTPAAVLEERIPDPATRIYRGADSLWISGEHALLRITKREVRRYGAADGLLHDVVRTVTEDSEGNIWLGTRAGLARLRPRFVQSYTMKDGLPSDQVTAVLETKAGELWVGTEDGLARRRGDKWQSFKEADGLPSSTIRALVEGPDGAVWVGTMRGMARYHAGRFTSWVTRSMIRSLAFDTQGRLWTATHSHGLHRLENNELVLVRSRAELCNTNPTVIVPAADGGLRIGGLNAFVYFKDGKARCDIDPAFAPRNDLRYLRVEDEEIWLGSIGGLARVKDGKRQSFAWRGGPLRTAVYSILDDGLGAFWLGTPKGLFQVSRQQLESDGATLEFRAYGIEDGMPTGVGTGDGDPSAWKGADGRLYFTTAAGLAVVDPRRVDKSAVPPRLHVKGVIADQRPVPRGEEMGLPAGTRDVQIDFVGLSLVAPEGVVYKYRLEGYDRDWIAAGARRFAYYTNLPPREYRFRVIAANRDGVWNNEGGFLDFALLPRFYQRSWFMPLVAALLVGAGVSFYRLRVAALRTRQVELQRHVDEAVANLKVLRGLLPICASCKRVRDDTGYWDQIETYLGQHTEAGFSHSVCPDCLVKLYPDYAAAMKQTAS